MDIDKAKLRTFIPLALSHYEEAMGRGGDAGGMAAREEVTRNVSRAGYKSLLITAADMLKATQGLPLERRRALDEVLVSQGAPTLSEMATGMGSISARVLKRNRIANDDEAQFLRSVLDAPDLSDEFRGAIQALVDKYEQI